MKNDSKSRRVARYRDSLSVCDSLSVRENILIDKIIELEDSLFELQQNYMELLINIKHLRSDLCVRLPF